MYFWSCPVQGQEFNDPNESHTTQYIYTYIYIFVYIYMCICMCVVSM